MDTYCLKWTKFQLNVLKTLSDWRKEEDFFDVTLVSEELKHISAHKLVLSSSSDLFKSILKATQTSNPHPLIYLSGVSAKHLNLAMNYIYQGEVEILQEDLGEFLNVARKLKIEGLIEGNPSKEGQEVGCRLQLKQKSLWRRTAFLQLLSPRMITTSSSSWTLRRRTFSSRNWTTFPWFRKILMVPTILWDQKIQKKGH